MKGLKRLVLVKDVMGRLHHERQTRSFFGCSESRALWIRGHYIKYLLEVSVALMSRNRSKEVA